MISLPRFYPANFDASRAISRFTSAEFMHTGIGFCGYTTQWRSAVLKSLASRTQWAVSRVVSCGNVGQRQQEQVVAIHG